jgi:hypothetical protein
MDSDLFLTFSREKPSLMRERERDRERERKSQPERSTVARLSWRTDSIRELDGHGHIPSQPFPV